MIFNCTSVRNHLGSRVKLAECMLLGGSGVKPFKDFKFVPLVFVTLGFGAQISLLRAIFHGFGTQTQGTNPKGTKENSLILGLNSWGMLRRFWA